MLEPTVHVLLATYQGEAFLKQQLDSLTGQSYTNWHLHISDDASTDSTLQIIAEFIKGTSQVVTVYDGPCKGVTYNFFHLINTVASHPADLYAFCDQDDVWLPDKLRDAVAHFQNQTLATNQLYLYCTRTNIVDSQLGYLGLSAVPRKRLGFGNALVQNIASGNTMVFNNSLLETLRLVDLQYSVLHDWTAYQVVTGCGGVIHFSDKPSLLYRQHSQNLVGSNNSIRARFKRFRFLLQGGYRRWSLQTICAMHKLRPVLAPENAQLLHLFESAHQKPDVTQRLSLLKNRLLWRQTRLGQASLLFALIFNLL